MIALSTVVSTTPESTFWMDLLKLLLGFLFTTVFGGLLGWWLQSRSWAHQNRVRLLEVERGEASKVFDEVSRLMDKRLYRMMKLHWTLKRGASEEDVKQHLQEYREVLYEWNDALNRNLALTEAYFGPKIRAHLRVKSTRNSGASEANWKSATVSATMPPRTLDGLKLLRTLRVSALKSILLTHQ
jgi:hypothetical protein